MVQRNRNLCKGATRTRERALSGFLSADRIDFEILANFLRDRSKLQRCFQIRHVSFGKPRYIEAEKVFAYEHASKARVSDATREHLLGEIESDEFYTAPIPNRLIFDELESFFKTTNVSLDKPDTLQQLKQHLSHSCFNADQVMPDLQKFCRTAPRLPVAGEKEFSSTPVIDLDGIASAFEARERVIALSKANETCGLALAAYRDLDLAPWKPFLKAALERNPVSVSGAGDLSIDQAFGKISAFVNESIYAEPSRVAQPDEVWNYGRGDGIEKAITLANIIRSRDKNAQISMERTGDTVTLVGPDNKPYSFVSAKTVRMPDGNDFA